MMHWYTAAEIAQVLRISARAVSRRAKTEQWRYQIRPGKGCIREYAITALPEEAQAKLLARHAPAPAAQHASLDREALWAHYDRAPQKAKDRAAERARILRAARTLATRTNKTDAFGSVAEAHGIHPSTLFAWDAQVNGSDASDWLAILLPSHTGRIATAECSPEAWETYKADYLRAEAPAATACYERLQRAARARNWTIPSAKTLARRLDREIPLPMQLLARRGVDALKRAYPAQQRDHAWYRAMEAVNADGHKFDVFVVWPDGEIVRAVMVAWQDLFSGRILSYRLEKFESSHGYRLSFGDMVEQHGIPHHAYLDNGRGIAAKHLTGGAPNRYRFAIRAEDPVGILTQLLGPEGIHWTTPYHGQAKPIERAFRDLCEYVAKHPAFSGAYTGNNPMAKPENYRSRAIPLADFKAVLAEEIRAHNARAGRRSPVCAGRSFDQVFAESYARHPIRKATAAQRRLWLLAAEGLLASRTDGSIQIAGNRYWCDALARYAGKRVVARFDPDNLHNPVYVYQLDGRDIGQADCIQRAGFGDMEAAKEHTRLRRRWINTQKEQLALERRMSAADVAAQLPRTPEPPEPASRVVRPAALKNKRAIGSDVSDTDLDDHNRAFDAAVLDLANRSKSGML